jgi:hypothetical protein
MSQPLKAEKLMKLVLETHEQAWISTEQSQANAIPTAMAGSRMHQAHNVILTLYNLVRR